MMKNVTPPGCKVPLTELDLCLADKGGGESDGEAEAVRGQKVRVCCYDVMAATG